MAPNRRNYYRVLHVQADAPPEVIKASYRALIGVHHPDHGGDHQVASLLNEAYAVLSHDSRRQAYDAKRAIRPNRQTGANPQGSAGGAADIVRHSCAFCRSPRPAVVRRDTRCTRCHAPLASALAGKKTGAAAERRGLPRVSKSDWGLLHISWPGEPIDVRMRDLSLDGISLYTGNPLPNGTTVRIVADVADVVADVVSCRRVDKIFTLHAQLVTAIFTTPTGGFVSTSA